jgi:hypothetical protein
VGKGAQLVLRASQCDQAVQDGQSPFVKALGSQQGLRGDSDDHCQHVFHAMMHFVQQKGLRFLRGFKL